MANLHIDAACTSLTKYTEELCGDHVEILRRDDSLIMVLSDGLGSGVKANILSTITGKIISTMMDGGASLEDTVETVVNTLPVCSVRKVAYSTFSILKVTNDGKVCLTEFDSPACVFVRNDRLMSIDYESKSICGHSIKQAHFTVQSGDLLVLMSDGVIYSGLGKLYPLGWGFKNASEYIAALPSELNAKAVSDRVCRKCNDLYANTPEDDTTVATVKIELLKTVNLFSGPPVHIEDDERAVHDFLSGGEKKVICGGSSAKIVARVMGEELKVSIDYVDPQIPPTATINGIDLVTEGVLTLNRTIELLRSYRSTNVIPEGKNAAELLANMLITDCTNLNLFIGMKKNPAHTKNGLINDLGLRMLILNDLYKIMQQLGKTVTRKYY
jgi:hypothetical protein